MTDIKKLAAKIEHHRNLYYNKAEPEISDAEFDALVSKLRKLDPKHPVLKKVGAKPQGKKRPHAFYMGSLDTVVGKEDFKSWYDRTQKVHRFVDMCVELKMDGSSLDLIYFNGLLQQAITRGDGQEGDDVWHAAARIPDLPKSVDKFVPLEKVCVRGEVILHKDDLKHFPGAANCRNTAAGTLKREDGKGAEHLHFYAYSYEVIGADGKPTDGKLKSEYDRMEYLSRVGFNVVTHEVKSTLKEVAEIHALMDEKRDEIPFEFDGLVVKVDDRTIQSKLQELSDRGPDDDPRWACAFKWVEKQYKTTIEDVEYSVGRTGAITPVAIVKPVKIGGVTVTRASLANFNNVDELGVCISDEVAIVRAGEVIPQVKSVTQEGPPDCRDPIERPAYCPVCKSKTFEDGPRQVCENPACPAQVDGRIQNWCAKRDMLGFGPEIVSRLTAAGIDSIVKLYTTSSANFVKAVGSEVVGKKLLRELDKSRKCTLADMVGSVGIEGLGRTEAKKLFDNGYNESRHLFAMQVNDLLRFDGYKQTKAKKIVNGIQGAAAMLKELEKHLEIEKPVKAESAELSGWAVCFTGCRPTKDEETALVKKGGKVVSGVSKATSHLVMKDKSSGSSKADKAKSLGVKLITYKEFQGAIG